MTRASRNWRGALTLGVTLLMTGVASGQERTYSYRDISFAYPSQWEVASLPPELGQGIGLRPGDGSGAVRGGRLVRGASIKAVTLRVRTQDGAAVHNAYLETQWSSQFPGHRVTQTAPIRLTDGRDGHLSRFSDGGRSLGYLATFLGPDLLTVVTMVSDVGSAELAELAGALLDSMRLDGTRSDRYLSAEAGERSGPPSPAGRPGQDQNSRAASPVGNWIVAGQTCMFAAEHTFRCDVFYPDGTPITRVTGTWTDDGEMTGQNTFSIAVRQTFRVEGGMLLVTTASGFKMSMRRMQ